MPIYLTRISTKNYVQRLNLITVLPNQRVNIGIKEFQTRVCFAVEYINNNAKGRDIFAIGLSGFNNRQNMISSFTS